MNTVSADDLVPNAQKPSFYHILPLYNLRGGSMGRLAQFGILAVLALPFAAYVAPGCGGEDTSGSGLQSTGSATTMGTAGTAAGGAGGEGGGAGGGAGGGVGGTGVPTMTGTCQGKIYKCGDLLDNDGDGKVDWQDPDCLGTCDDTEDSFYGGIPGQAGPGCIVDCYFDQDSGAGNDGCYWNHACDPNSVAPNYYPEPENGSKCEYDPKANTPGTSGTCEQLNAMQADVCHNYCGPLTPNGCDCFGCCELPPGGGQFVFLGSLDKTTGAPSCKLADLADPEKCHPCKPVDACLNGCGKCELCVGKDSLPPECFPDGGAGGMGGAGGSGDTMQCPVGIQPCGLPGQADCAINYYCITGCCQSIPG
jgi:hypothetical protein